MAYGAVSTLGIVEQGLTAQLLGGKLSLPVHVIVKLTTEGSEARIVELEALESG